MLSVYLAARYAWKPYMREVRDRLVAEKIHVTSQWIDGACESADKEMAALINIANLDEADVLVCFTDHGDSVGRHIEFGYALHAKKALVIVGEDHESVFHHLTQVAMVNDVEDLVNILKELHSLRKTEQR